MLTKNKWEDSKMTSRFEFINTGEFQIYVTSAVGNCSRLHMCAKLLTLLTSQQEAGQLCDSSQPAEQCALRMHVDDSDS